jgi:hypothetical protein
MFLTAAELAELTGYKLPGKQRAWLARNGIAHWVNAAGRPVVPRAAIEGRPAAANDEPEWQPRVMAR